MKKNYKVNNICAFCAFFQELDEEYYCNPDKLKTDYSNILYDMKNEDLEK